MWPDRQQQQQRNGSGTILPTAAFHGSRSHEFPALEGLHGLVRCHPGDPDVARRSCPAADAAARLAGAARRP